MCNCGCQCKGKKQKCCKPRHHVRRCPTEVKKVCGCEAKLTVTVHKPAKKFHVHKEKCEKKQECHKACAHGCSNAYLCCDRAGCGYNFGLDFINDN
ncbi:hypothetical protein Klosneuvirus_6_88 [Klosneuvirus KNV1]|uniref:Uncharacterized protein n=1 Tax=Klosneuvirus KNV1 TaxID=1977640 RepID=A0A1V0SLF1_9VIRU|nr:hypothetical protein Klosneuvirus_6_88 [Klosneuvirus KNV1]